MQSWRAFIKKYSPRAKGALALLLLLALGPACAELKPLQPLKDLSLQARQAEIDSHKVDVGDFTASVGGHFLPFAKYFDLAAYYRDCHCPEAAVLADDWDSEQKWVFISTIGGALLIVGSQFHGVNTPNMLIPGIAFLALGLDLDHWSRMNWLKPSADEFNLCLERQAAALGSP